MGRKKRAVLNFFGGIADKIRSWDYYGQQVTFNFMGNDSIQTIPGAVISVAMKLAVFAYAYIKVNDLIKNQGWGLIK